MRTLAGGVVLPLALILGCWSRSERDPADGEEIAASAANARTGADPGASARAAPPARGKGKNTDKGGKAKDSKAKDKANLPTDWYADYDQALAQARKTGQPLLVLFH
jgi:hypothetical protein